MPSVYDNDNFAGRVNYATTVISRKGGHTRHFDTCFEMDDASEVAVAVYRRSLRNPKLAANIWTYLARDTVMRDVEEMKDVKTRDLPALAAQSRTRAKVVTEKMLEDQRRKQASP
ncbi:hypothetical protein N5K21_26200 [Rhizobium pusense]|uniref:hypothetical protein n=1 Tax=Agrobacterium pusense TaxID=648995 RepID=UPI00244BBA9A|nr:hypothetical protein [Agrobacterium pusense]MDH2092218.1 hypothetical protein [Agrobacterium pusense]